MGLCLYCKENHASEACPLYLKAQVLFRSKQWKLSLAFGSQSPAPFVGHFGYPQISVGFLAPPQTVDNTWEYDAPRFWAEGEYPIQKIVGFRGNLVNSRQVLPVKIRKNNVLSSIQEIGMAKKPVDVDVVLAKTPVFSVRADGYSAPTGPSGTLKKVTLTSNPIVSSKVEHVVADTDLLAASGIESLYDKGVGSYELSKLLSVGVLGMSLQRKLVPTRWSITATDDILGKHLREEVRDYPETGYELYVGGYLGNYYALLFFPGTWSYELFEGSLNNKGMWATDVEAATGRKQYASQTAGGYYACRLSILEHLKKRKRQARVLAVRVITSEYTVPLGVWVVREATRKVLASQPTQFDDKQQMSDQAMAFFNEQFGVDISQVLSDSKLIKMLAQRSLLMYKEAEIHNL